MTKEEILQLAINYVGGKEYHLAQLLDILPNVINRWKNGYRIQPHYAWAIAVLLYTDGLGQLTTYRILTQENEELEKHLKDRIEKYIAMRSQ